MKKAAESFGFTIVMLLMVASVLTYLAPHFGWRVDAVCSGSMEPQLKVGTVVITRPMEPEAIAVGDVITFNPTMIGENPICHRVIGVEKHSPLYFKTKGDANDVPDPFIVPARNVLGRVWFYVPYLGYATEFLKTPSGFWFGLVIPGLIIITMYVRNIWWVFAKAKKGKSDEVARG